MPENNRSRVRNLGYTVIFNSSGSMKPKLGGNKGNGPNLTARAVAPFLIILLLILAR